MFSPIHWTFHTFIHLCANSLLHLSIHPSIYSSFHPSIHPPTNSLTDLPIHSSTQPPIHSMHPSLHSPTLSSMDPSVHSPINSLILSSIIQTTLSSTRPSVQLYTHLLSTHPPIHPSIHPPTVLSFSVQFSRSVMSHSLWPHGLQHTRPPCPSPTPRVYSNSCPSSRWCHPTTASSVVPFSSCPQSFSASGSFPVSQLFASGGQSIGVAASTWVSFYLTLNRGCRDLGRQCRMTLPTEWITVLPPILLLKWH